MAELEFNKYNFKIINDPVHGTIGLSELEVAILNTKVFQRLRNVKQLGLANFVFPSADFTRFSHSLGVCHLTGKIFETLRRNDIFEIADEDIRDYRIAGLLHDIGHYPYSHTMEEAIEEYYESHTREYEEIFISEDSGNSIKPAKKKISKGTSNFLNHMSVGREILIHDNQIQEIFANNGIDTELIYSIFTRDNAPKYSNVISSDLDADRIDYLLRSASSTGLPYGNVDLNYLVSQMRVDKDGKFCLSPKALRTADHFLLCRYFEYSQVIHHKAVAAFEMILKEVIIELLKKEDIDIDCSYDGIIESINSGFWNIFDDAFILQKIRELKEDLTIPKVTKEIINSIIERNPPKEIFKFEFIGNRDKKDDYKRKIHSLNKLIPKIAEKSGLDEDYLKVWNNQIKLTKVSHSIGYKEAFEHIEDEEDEYEQTISIYDPLTGKSSHIMEIENSLMSVLSEKSLFTVRLYALFPSEIEPKDQKTIKNEIFQLVKDEMPYD